MSELKEQSNMWHIFFYYKQLGLLLLILIILSIAVHILCFMQIILTLKTTISVFCYTSHTYILQRQLLLQAL